MVSSEYPLTVGICIIFCCTCICVCAFKPIIFAVLGISKDKDTSLSFDTSKELEKTLSKDMLYGRIPPSDSDYFNMRTQPNKVINEYNSDLKILSSELNALEYDRDSVKLLYNVQKILVDNMSTSDPAYMEACKLLNQLHAYKYKYTFFTVKKEVELLQHHDRCTVLQSLRNALDL